VYLYQPTYTAVYGSSNDMYGVQGASRGGMGVVAPARRTMAVTSPARIVPPSTAIPVRPAPPTPA